MEFLRTDIFAIWTVVIILLLLIFSVNYLFFQKNISNISKNYEENKKLKRIRNISLVIAIISLIFANLWPVMNIELSGNNKWKNVVFVFDVSKSMGVVDTKIDSKNSSRIDFAKSLATNYVTNNTENFYWIMNFKKTSYIVSPLSNNLETIINSIKWITIDSTAWWTSLETAVIDSLSNFSNEKDNIFVIMSDWWEVEDSLDLAKIKEKIWEKNYIVTVGIWSTNWNMIPDWVDIFGNTKYKTYNGENVISKLYEKNLQKIAEITNWIYIKADSKNTLQKINELTSKIEKYSNISLHREKNDWSRNILILGFIAFLTYLFIPYKKRLWK